MPLKAMEKAWFWMVAMVMMRDRGQLRRHLCWVEPVDGLPDVGWTLRTVSALVPPPDEPALGLIHAPQAGCAGTDLTHGAHPEREWGLPVVLLSPLPGAADREAWLEWVRSRPLATLEAGWLCVHAGVVPAWDVAQTLEVAHEVHTMLQGSDRGDFLQSMYGNDPAQWSEQLHHHDRWRFIINTLTRIRFCTPHSRLELTTKEGLGSTPEGYWPWFDVPGRRTQGHPVAFGHWSTVGWLQRDDLLSLDTGCVWGGSLSAVRVDGGRRELFQVPCTEAISPAARPD